MRRKTTPKNYGKYHEAVLICPPWYSESCEQVAQTLTNSHGILTKAINYEEYKDISATTKKLLRKSYYVIFFLGDGIVEGSLNHGDDHPFLKFYAYAHKTNPFAIACVALNGYNVEERAAYPRYMGDFASLHRKEYTLSNNHEFNTDFNKAYGQIKNIANDLAKEIRQTYSDKNSMILEGLHRHGLAESKNYLKEMCSIIPKITIGIILTLILLYICAFFDSAGYGLVCFLIFAMFVFLQTFVTLISIKRKKENIGIPKNMASSQKKDATSTHIIRTNRWAGKKLVALMILISSGILVLAFCLALSITHDILYPLSIFFIWFVLKFIADGIIALKMKNKLDKFNSFLSFSIQFEKYKKNAKIIRFLFFVVLSTVSTIILLLTIEVNLFKL